MRANAMIRLPLVFVFSLMLLACPGDPEPEVPDISGSYNVVIGSNSIDGDCPPAVSRLEVFAFVGVLNTTVSGPLDIEQTGSNLSADFAGCEGLIGGVSADSVFTLSGDCVWSGGSAEVLITGNYSVDGTIRNITGSMEVDVDHTDGMGGAADGSPDCVLSGDLVGSY